MSNLETIYAKIWDDFDDFTDCIKKSDIDKVKDFLNNPNFDPTLSNFIAFEYASCCVDSNVFKLFLNDSRFIDNSRYEDGFVSACSCNETDIVNEFLNVKDFDITFNDHLAFLMACRWLHFDTIHLFLENKNYQFLKLNIKDFKEQKNLNSMFSFLLKNNKLKDSVLFHLDSNNLSISKNEVLKMCLLKSVNDF